MDSESSESITSQSEEMSADANELSYKGCAFISIKFILLGALCLGFYLLGLNTTQIQFEDDIRLLLVLCYLCLQIGIGTLLKRIPNQVVFIGILILVSLEALVVLTIEYNHILPLLLFSAALYIFLIGYLQKNYSRFTPKMALLLLILFIFLFMAITVIFFKDQFQKGIIPQNQIPGFIAIYTYCMWLTIFQYDTSKIEFLSGMKIFFGLGYDFVCVIKSIYMEITLEWDNDISSNEKALMN